ncbi:MAG: hypothetical protein RLZ75_2563, partial [Pseudomonadota bacterium]
VRVLVNYLLLWEEYKDWFDIPQLSQG